MIQATSFRSGADGHSLNPIRLVSIFGAWVLEGNLNYIILIFCKSDRKGIFD